MWIVDGYTTSQRLPVRAADHARRRHHRLADRAAAAPSLALPTDQVELHPQLGQGRRRRLRRHGDALRVGRRATRCSRPGGSVPGHRASRSREIPRSRCWRTCATRRTCSRSSATLLAPLPRHRRRRTFYSGQDFWKVPNDPTVSSAQGGPAAVLPDAADAGQQDAATFSLTTTFAPNNRRHLAAFMAVDSAPGPDYGTIRVLQLPSTDDPRARHRCRTTSSPTRRISSLLTLLRNGGSRSSSATC